MERTEPEFRCSRRRLVRRLLRLLSHLAFGVLTDLQIVGTENLPKGGPLLVVGNHFSFIDPVATVRATPWPLEFVGGFRMPNAPASVTWPRHRGAFGCAQSSGVTLNPVADSLGHLGSLAGS